MLEETTRKVEMLAYEAAQDRKRRWEEAERELEEKKNMRMAEERKTRQEQQEEWERNMKEKRACYDANAIHPKCEPVISLGLTAACHVCVEFETG